jgi:hypothetical protein
MSSPFGNNRSSPGPERFSSMNSPRDLHENLNPTITTTTTTNPNLSPGITRIDAVNHFNTADVDSNKPTLRDATNKSVCIFHFIFYI